MAAAGMAASGMASGASGAASAVMKSEAAQIALQVIVAVAGLVLVLVIIMFLVLSPPRLIKPFHVGTSASEKTSAEFRGILARFVRDHGLRMQGWWRGKTARAMSSRDSADSELLTLHDMLDRWAVRGRDSFLSPIFVAINSGRPPCSSALASEGGPEPSPKNPECVDFRGNPALRWYDYPGRLWVAEGACVSKQLVEAQPGTEYPRLRAATLLADFEAWLDRSEWDPVRVVKRKDIARLDSIANFDLFTVSVGLFVSEVLEPEALPFKYTSAGDLPGLVRALADTEDDYQIALEDGGPVCGMPLLSRMCLVAEGIPAACVRAAAEVRAAVDRLTELVSSALADNLSRDHGAQEGLAKKLRTPFRWADETDPSELVDLFSRLPPPPVPAGRGNASDPTAAYVELSSAYRELAQTALAAAGYAEACDSEAAAGSLTSGLCDRLALAAGTMPFGGPSGEIRRVYMSAAAQFAFDPRDVCEARDATLRMATSDPAFLCDTDDRVAEALRARYDAYLNARNAVPYAESYLITCKEVINYTHLNEHESKIFWCMMAADITEAYVKKNSNQPHVTSMGAVYDVESVNEYTKSFWDFNRLISDAQTWASDNYKSGLSECVKAAGTGGIAGMAMRDVTAEELALSSAERSFKSSSNVKLAAVTGPPLSEHAFVALLASGGGAALRLSSPTPSSPQEGDRVAVQDPRLGVSREDALVPVDAGGKPTDRSGAFALAPHAAFEDSGKAKLALGTAAYDGKTLSLVPIKKASMFNAVSESEGRTGISLVSRDGSESLSILPADGVSLYLAPGKRAAVSLEFEGLALDSRGVSGDFSIEDATTGAQLAVSMSGLLTDPAGGAPVLYRKTSLSNTKDTDSAGRVLKFTQRNDRRDLILTLYPAPGSSRPSYYALDPGGEGLQQNPGRSDSGSGTRRHKDEVESARRFVFVPGARRVYISPA